MKLLSSGTSPFVRKVLITLHETNQLGDVEIVPVSTTPFAVNATVTAANPIGKIPALIREDGPALYDSRVICRFLDHRAKAGLYPENRVWDVLTLEATADGLLEAALLMVYEARLRDEEQRSPDWVEAQWDKIDRALTAVNSLWMSHLHGRMDMGHIAMGAALSYLDLRHDARNWRAGRDALAAWHKSFAERPSMLATAPQG
ncbi:glutathione S-transferase [Puniceibacterium confluentis]|uniref:glutathione S-transferase n=1 Tax=Puniceibacterium confluentis TaxID=1958944 RepID=UPI0011B49E1D|nr:glutathione S-transferase [Puniceibacterium confluentis]